MANIYWGAHGAAAAGANPSILFLGDSWLWYPAGNLPQAIGSAFQGSDFVVAGRNGAEAAEWATRYRKEIDFTFRLYASGAQALVLSGGGNDIAGMADFLKILAPDCSKAKTVADCYGPGQPDGVVSLIMAAYRGVILKFRAHEGDKARRAAILMHNYDHAWPTGDGVFGPADWLKAPMDAAKVPKKLRRDLFKDLLSRLRAAQLQLQDDASLEPLVAVASAGTMPDEPGWWANELHPTPAGFRLIGKKAFVPVLKKWVTA